MTGRGPIFWGQPEYTVGRSAEHDSGVRQKILRPLAGPAKKIYTTDIEVVEYLRCLGVG